MIKVKLPKIKLLTDISVEDKHGLRKDRVFNILRAVPLGQRSLGGIEWYVIGDTGEEIGIRDYEAYLLTEEVNDKGETNE